MKKIFTLFAIFACLPILLSAKGPAVIGGSTYTADTLSHYKVGPGTYYTAIHFYGPKDMRAFYLEIKNDKYFLIFKNCCYICRRTNLKNNSQRPWIYSQ